MMFLDLDFVTSALRTLCAWICDLVYSLISWVYQLFMTVSRVNILSSDAIQPIYQRVTMILTIVMIFYVTFEFVKYVMQPDSVTDKEKGVGNVAMRIVIVIILIAMVPRIFSIAYRVQNSIIENQVFSKVILGEQNSDFANFGSDFSANILSLFYHVDEEKCGSKCDTAKETVDTNLNNLRQNGEVSITTGLNESANVDGEDVPIIKFDGLLAMIVGGFIVYILVMYSVDVGVRYAQLIFLQIMSPIAIIGYISPKKDGTFQKWGKQCITTYIDLFIRLAIIYFVLLIIKVLGNAFDTGSLFTNLGGITGTIKTFTYIVLVIGLLVFAYKAPKMLSDLFPMSGSASIGYGLGAKGRYEPALKTAKGGYGAARKGKNAIKRTAGGAAGVLYGATKGALAGKRKNLGNAMWSGLKGAKAGFKAGAGKDGGIRKATEAARASAHKDIDIIESGGTPFGADVRGGHAQDKAKEQDVQVARYDEMVKRKKAVGNTVKEIKATKLVEGLRDTAQAAGNSELKVRLEGDIKAVEKASRVYAMTGNDAGLRVAVKNSLVGTGALSKDVENALKLEMSGDDFATQIKDGTLSHSIIDSLAETQLLTVDLKNIMKKDADKRTDQDKLKIEAFLAANEEKQSSLNKFVNDNMELDDRAKWGRVEISLAEAQRISADVGDVIIKIKRNGKEEPVKIKDLKKHEFAENIGKISDECERLIDELKADPEYIQSHANASNSGKK